MKPKMELCLRCDQPFREGEVVLINPDRERAHDDCIGWDDSWEGWEREDK